jgi:DNA-binding LacI/PurR family transcriptional regulator
VAQGIDALCVIAPRSSALELFREHSSNMPTLVIKAEPDPHLHTVAVDQYTGARMAVAHLIGLGIARSPTSPDPGLVRRASPLAGVAR